MPARTELARVDLRGRTPSAAELRAALPRGGVDVDAVVPTGAPDRRRGRRRAAPRRPWSTASRSTACAPRPVRVPRAELASALDRARRRRARRPRGRDRAGPRGARRPAAHRHHHDARARRDGHRALGAGRAGRALRAGRQRGLPVQRRDERRARADRGRRLAGRSRARRRPQFGGLPHPTILAAARAARRRRGVGGRRRARPSRCWPTAAPTPTAPNSRRST